MCAVVWGAIVLFVLCLYPYVYLLTRTALAERGVALMEAARLLGAGMRRRVGEVAMPLARPAIFAGVALALMETLADYGVGSYFGLSTFTTGIYKAWLVMNDRDAAAQLSSLLLLVVAGVVWLEARARRQLRFSHARAGAVQSAEARPMVLSGRRMVVAWSLCGLPVVLGFVLPVAVLLRLLWLAVDERRDGVAACALCAMELDEFQARRIRRAARSSACACARFALRSPGQHRRPLQFAGRMVSLGYAVPGAVIAVGILLPMGWLQESLSAALVRRT